MVFHRTFDRGYVVANPYLFIRNEICGTMVHCLFNEDEGLLRCPKNDDAKDKVEKKLRQAAKGGCQIMWAGRHSNNKKGICAIFCDDRTNCDTIEKCVPLSIKSNILGEFLC